MANLLYDLGREAFLAGNLAWATDNIKVGLVDTSGYTYSSAHQYWSSVTAASRVAESGNLLIARIDTATGLPVTPNGGDITVQWDAGADKIFTL
jgi:hypothetical protein